MRWPAALAPLRHRPFLFLSAGSLLTFLGSNIQGVGAAWQMTSLTDSSTLVALVQSAVTLPALLFALVGGALADMFNRRRVLLAAQAVMLIAAASLLAAQGLGLMTPWLLIALTFAVNVGTALRMPVQSALANDLVQRAEVPAAVAVTGIGANLGRSLGPGIGGALIAAAGVAFAFAASMACIAGAILTSAGWRNPAAHDGMRHTHMGRAIVEGLAHAYRDPAIRTLQVRLFAWVFCAGALWGLLPLIARHTLGGDSRVLGMLLASQGVGAVIGAAGTSRWHRSIGMEALLRGLTACFAAVMLVAATSTRPGWTVVALLLGGAAWSWFLTAPSTVVQLLAPAPLRGRLIALNLMTIYSGMGLGSAFWGMAADAFGLRGALLTAAAALAANLLLALWIPYRS